MGLAEEKKEMNENRINVVTTDPVSTGVIVKRGGFFIVRYYMNLEGMIKKCSFEAKHLQDDILYIAPNASGYPRIDTVIVRTTEYEAYPRVASDSTIGLACETAILQGYPSIYPKASKRGRHETPLAFITVASGFVVIHAEDITLYGDKSNDNL